MIAWQSLSAEGSCGCMPKVAELENGLDRKNSSGSLLCCIVPSIRFVKQAGVQAGLACTYAEVHDRW